MLQLIENLEDEYAQDVNMTDNDLKEGSSLVSQESNSDDIYVDDAMDIDLDFANETIAFGSADQPKTTGSSSDSPPAPIQTSTAVEMSCEPPTPNKITPATTAESSKKIKATSAIHEGLSMAKNTQQSRGLFKYFKECSREQYLMDVARETEKWTIIVDQESYAMEEANQIKKANLRERARERKRKSRLLKKNREVQKGLRSPGGTKRRV